MKLTAQIPYADEQNFKTAAGEQPVGPDFKLLPAFAGFTSTDGKPVGCDVDAL